jgi:O-antigen/teichoic acid export membrane protein
LGLVYLFIDGPENAPLMNFFFGITSLSVYIPLWLVIYRKEKIQFYWVKWSEILFRIKENFHYFLSSVGGHIHIHGGLIILGLFAGNSILGKYALAQKIAFLLRMIPVFFTQAILQKAVKHQKNLSKDSNKEITHLYYLGLGSTLLMGILVALFAKWIIYVQGGRFVSYSAGVLQILAFIPFLSMLNFRNMITILVEEKQVILNKATWFTAIFMVITSCFTCYFYGGYGLAFALIATEIVSYFSHSILLKQHGIKTS